MAFLRRLGIFLYFIIVTSFTASAAGHGKPAPLCTPVSSPVLSPDRSQAAYDLSCAVDGKSPVIRLVITNPTSRKRSQFSVQPPKQFGEACLAEGQLSWLDNSRLRLLCNYSSALNDYLIVNTKTENVEDDYPGFYFQPSPGGKLLARIGILQRYGSPLGQKYCLLFNRATIYPPDCTFEGEGPATHPFAPKHKHFSNDAYSGIHTFLSPLAWSPDSRHAALVEKVFNWDYSSPYNRDFNGYANHVRYYLAIISADRPPVGYSITAPVNPLQLQWQTPSQLTLEGAVYNLTANPPRTIP